MSAVDLDTVLAGLRNFQRDAVEHVSDQFYGARAAEHSGRFLIADETGLGKSVIARGVVAKAIRQLENDEDRDRITVVYICSNRDLARQNLSRLNVTDQEEIAMATRLTLLARETAKLKDPGPGSEGSGGQQVNLVSFTPGTSFSALTWRQGNADERALLVLLLDLILQHSADEKYLTRLMMQGSVTSVQRFSSTYVDAMDASLQAGIDPSIYDEFERLARTTGIIDEFVRLRELVAAAPTGDGGLAPQLRDQVRTVIGRLRTLLAKAGVQTLQPDLVILDEFQRFKSLLEGQSGDEAAELADALFSYPEAKVLLLSATPYKPFTRADVDEEDHYEDFLATISFLNRHDPVRVNQVQKALRDYREAVSAAGDAGEATQRVREALIPVMTRSERPSLIEDRDVVHVDRVQVPVPSAADLTEWVNLSKLGETVGGTVSLEYWKSVPYFVNFMGNYLIGKQISEAAAGPLRTTTARGLRRSRSLDPSAISRRAQLDPGNGPLRALISKTLDQGWWKLLWMPPSMPYLTPGPVYRQFEDANVTKQVLFSAWSAAPTSIATILSHEAERRMLGIGRKGLDHDATESSSQRLTYQRVEGRAASESTLTMFWPHPNLLKHTDQLQAARSLEGLVDPEQLVADISAALPAGRSAERAWQAFFAYPGAFEGEAADQAHDVEHDRGHDELLGLEANITAAQAFAAEHTDTGLSHPELARIAAFSPGSVAYRAVSTIAGSQCTGHGKWRAAFTIAEGLRALFNRPEAQALLDQLADASPAPYWRRVLDYCADGNLRAVLDEYLFQLWCETGQADLNDDQLIQLARQAAAALRLRPTHYVAHEANLDRTQLPMPARFALRYGGGEQAHGESDSQVARQSGVRSAFNSPFAPFVLASTSVGQEGIDFHWWSHSVVHWNLPSNPVDFEQREGRVNRFGGHAVRKNVGRAHWREALQSTDLCAWRAAFEAAEAQPSEAGDFSPWWVYKGPARIQRILLQHPLSRDIERYEQLREALTRYRLTLGQPRQEDMVEMLQRRNIDAQNVPTISLRPPRFTAD